MVTNACYAASRSREKRQADIAWPRKLGGTAAVDTQYDGLLRRVTLVGMALVRIRVSGGQTPTWTAEVVEGPMLGVESVLNPNAFSLQTHPQRERLLAHLDGCRDHLAVVGHAADVVRQEIRDDGDRLFASLQGSEFGDIESVVAPHIVRHGMGYFAGLFTALGAAKSALDCLAIVAVQIIDPGNKNDRLGGFHKGNIGAGEIASGARLVHWLRHDSGSKSPVFPGRLELGELFEKAARDWITEAVKYRDDLIHHGHLRGARGSTIILTRPVSEVQRSEICPPAMPSGVPVADYCSDLSRRLLHLAYDTIVLLPGIRTSLVTRPSP